MSLRIAAQLCLAAFAAARLEAAETNILTPEQAVARAVATHPALAMARQRTESALGARRAAGQLPNPLVAYGFEALDRAGADAGEWSVDAELPVDFLWRRGGRVRAAQARVAVTEAAASQAHADLRQQVLSTYADAFTAARHAQSLEAAEDVLDEVSRIGRIRLKEGDLSDYDVRRMELESLRVSRAAQQARLREATSRGQLALLMSADADSLRLLSLQADYPLPPTVAAPTALVELGLTSRAEVRMASAEAAAGRAEVERLERHRWPGLQAGLGYKEEEGGASGLTGRMSVELPLFDRAQGELQEARALQRRADLQAQWVRMRVEREIGILHARLLALHEQLEELPDEDELTDLLDTARQTYDEGDSDLVTLIDAVHSLTGEAELRWTLLQDYQTTYYELERAIGAPLTEASPRTEL